MSKIIISIECEPGEFRKILRELLQGEPGTPVTFTELKDQRQLPLVTDHGVGTVAQGEVKIADPKPAGRKPAKPKEDAPAGPPPSTAPVQGDSAATVQAETTLPAKEQAATVPADGTPTALSGLPDNIKTTNSMRDLLIYLKEHGVDSMDAMVATCLVLHKDVPILAKVPKVEERVRRACEVLQLYAAPEAEPAA